jgi:hypothetical protein
VALAPEHVLVAALFARPDSGSKAFTGQVVTDLDRFESRERPYLNAMAPAIFA